MERLPGLSAPLRPGSGDRGHRPGKGRTARLGAARTPLSYPDGHGGVRRSPGPGRDSLPFRSRLESGAAPRPLRRQPLPGPPRRAAVLPARPPPGRFRSLILPWGPRRGAGQRGRRPSPPGSGGRGLTPIALPPGGHPRREPLWRLRAKLLGPSVTQCTFRHRRHGRRRRRPGAR